MQFLQVFVYQSVDSKAFQINIYFFFITNLI